MDRQARLQGHSNLVSIFVDHVIFGSATETYLLSIASIDALVQAAGSMDLQKAPGASLDHAKNQINNVTSF